MNDLEKVLEFVTAREDELKKLAAHFVSEGITINPTMIARKEAFGLVREFIEEMKKPSGNQGGERNECFRQDIQHSGK